MAVARRIPRPVLLEPALLFEPVAVGRRRRVVYELDIPLWLYRTPRTDQTGAVAQRIVLRFALLGETRKGLAWRYGYSERQIQSIVSGRAWGEYTRPIRDWLEPFGVKFMFMWGGRGQLGGVVAAQADLIRQCEAALAHPERLAARELETLRQRAYVMGLEWAEDEREGGAR